MAIDVAWDYISNHAAAFSGSLNQFKQWGYLNTEPSNRNGAKPALNDAGLE